MISLHHAVAGIALALSATTLTWAAAPAERSGKAVFDAVCSSCHAKGLNGAPAIGDRAAWQQRATRGLQDLTRNAITGVRTMPAHGGQASLSDLEITRAVAYLVSGGTSFDTNKAYTLAKLRSGSQLVQERCVTCHATGVDGAPRIGVLEDWRNRLPNGVPALVKSAISGHKAMPARAGLGHVSDPEIQAAIEYMIARP